MNWTTKPVYDGSIIHNKPTLTINEDGPLGKAGEFTIEWAKTIKERPWPNEPHSPANSGVVINAIYQAGRYVNKVPTHDPYTNPNAELYYECDCGAILDPGTKSFAALNNAAMNSEWKIRWGHMYYEPFCPKCVKLKGIE